MILNGDKLTLVFIDLEIIRINTVIHPSSNSNDHEDFEFITLGFGDFTLGFSYI